MKRGPPRRLLVVASELAVNGDGTYRPGGLQQFSRCVLRALVSCPALDRVDGWSLADDAAGADFMQRSYLEYPVRASRVTIRSFAGDRKRMALAYAARAQRYDLAMFLHIGVGRLAALRPDVRTSLWLVGIEVRRPLGWLERRAVRRADPLLSISTFSSDEMVRHNPELSRPRARTVHLCVEADDPWARDVSAGARAAYDPRAREPSVLIVARMAAGERYKGHDQLVDAWPAVVARCPRAELWIVGSGDDEARLRARAGALPAPARDGVRFLGRLAHDELLNAYARARAFAMPSTGEGFGLVFVEAMREGLPCISSKDSAQEIVLDGKTGFVVDQEPRAIADACVALLSDDELARRMAEAGARRFAETFTFDAFRARLWRELGLA